MTQSWSQYVEGFPSFVWEQKLKSTKYALKNWAKKSLTTPMDSRQEKVQALAEIQLGMEEIEITKAQLVLEQPAQLKTFHSFLREEEYLHLKSRSLW